jgi:hypothetical protein
MNNIIEKLDHSSQLENKAMTPLIVNFINSQSERLSKVKNIDQLFLFSFNIYLYDRFIF